MLPERSTAGARLTAAFLLSALAIAGLPALGLAADSAATALEACRSCEGCDDGRCDDSSPFEAGDHCCPSSCLAHSLWTLSAPQLMPPSQRFESAVQHDSPAPLQAMPPDISEPPRR